MFRLLKRKAGPIIPILYVDANVNQANTANLLKKLRKFKYNLAQGIAVVCSVQNCMPVQVDKIHQQINRIKQQHKIPVYSFLLDQCTPQSYYMASNADQIYSLPSTIFQLQRNQNKISWDGLLEKYKLQRFVIKSNQNLSGASIDKYTSANTSHIGNKKDSHLSQRIYAQSIEQRIKNMTIKNEQKLNSIKQIIPKYIPKQLIGEQALKLGLVDKIGEHYQVLRQKYPDCHFEVIKYVEQPISIKKSLAILTSPLLLALFIFKVILKWSIIMYVWIKSKNSGKSKTIQQAKAQVEAQNSK